MAGVSVEYTGQVSGLSSARLVRCGAPCRTAHQQREVHAIQLRAVGPDRAGAVLTYTAVAVSGRVLAAMLAKLASSVKTGPIAVLQSQRIAQQCVGHVTPQERRVEARRKAR